jgi:hypothetical protein
MQHRFKTSCCPWEATSALWRIDPESDSAPAAAIIQALGRLQRFAAT